MENSLSCCNASFDILKMLKNDTGLLRNTYFIHEQKLCIFVKEFQTNHLFLKHVSQFRMNVYIYGGGGTIYTCETGLKTFLLNVKAQKMHLKKSIP